ncbi:transposase [Streptomyces sp. NPDC058470]|uniref:transposase n=1 Tax=Streptomyces sp. NPDC058470 TaxID=3346515 RepID=UPI00364AFB40
MDARLVIVRDQPLNHTHFPYIHLTATYCKVRVNHQIVSQAAIIDTGITVDSNHEVLGVTVGDNETLAFRAEFLRSLRARGLASVRLVHAGDRMGPAATIHKVMLGAAYQRCRVHFRRPRDPMSPLC